MFRIQENPKNRELFLFNKFMSKKMTTAIRRGAYVAGKELVKDLKQDMTHVRKSGMRYKIYRGLGGRKLLSPRFHTASSPSETPAVISGEFRKSINFRVLGNRRLEFGSGDNGLASKYAKILELGSSKMAARKPLGRTVKKLEFQTRTTITKEVDKVLNNK